MNKLYAAFLSIIILYLSVLPSHAATVEVSIIDSSFQPANITINAGDTVHWTNNGALPHTTTSGVDGNHIDGLWNSGTLNSGQSFSVMFNEAGTFPYHCSFHWFAGMKGTVTVNPPVSLMPLPSGHQGFVYLPVTAPEFSNNPAQAKPVGVGPVAVGGSMLDVQIGLNGFTGTVDVYGAYSLESAPGVIHVLNQDGVSFTAFTLGEILNSVASGIPPAGAQPWMANTIGTINVSLFNTAVSNLPSGTYIIYLLVSTPGSLADYYLWQTLFIVP
ncbi:MAG: cupredoxin domain-containing protein [Nitrospirae bacterium]|nr:cupredoxin domain-containing protein [Nitrospirota bacterium]